MTNLFLPLKNIKKEMGLPHDKGNLNSICNNAVAEQI
jgi:hypothetical protein